MTNLSASELEVMQVLWRTGEPMKIQDVCDALTDSDWKYNTVGTLLLRMAEKGAVASEKRGKAIYYSPLLDREEYKAAQTKSFVRRLYDGSARELAVSLFKSGDMTQDDIDEIRKMFNL